MSNTQYFNQAKAESFAGSFLDGLNKAALMQMVSIGHRSRLFDTLAAMQPATSEEVAQKTKLNERYVREWLGAMVTGGVMEYFPETKKYSLPAEHAAFLTRNAGADNLAVFSQYFSVLGGVEDAILECI